MALVGAFVLVTAACNPFADDDEPEPPAPTPPPTEPPSRVGLSVDGTLRIGAVVPLSGELATFGPGLQAAVELAVDDVNDAGGVEGDVELVIEDSQSTAEGALAATRRLIDEMQVDAIVGPTSSIELGGGMLDEALDAERVVCTPTAAAPRFDDADEKGLLFATTANREGEMELLAAEIEALPDDADSRVAVVRVDGDPDGDDLFQELDRELTDAFGAADAFEIVADVQLAPVEGTGVGEEADDGAEPPTDTGAPPVDEAFIAAVEEVQDARPDAVVLFLLPGEAVPLFRAMFDAGLLPSAGENGVAVYVTDTLASDQLAEAVDPRRPAVLEGVRGARPLFEPSGPDAFDERLKAKTAVRNVDFAARAYECTILIALGALAAGSDDPNLIKTDIVGLTASGESCESFAACASPLVDGDDVHYTGVLDLELNDAGEPLAGVFEVFEFDAQGDLLVIATATVVNPADAPPARAAPVGDEVDEDVERDAPRMEDP